MKGFQPGYGIFTGGSSAPTLYLGTWDASVTPKGNPDLSQTTPQTGAFYYVSTAGTNDYGTFEVNDQIIFNGTDWQKIPNANLRIDQIENSALSVYDLYVDSTYTGTSETGSTLQPYKTIQQAVDAAVDGEVYTYNLGLSSAWW